MSSSHLCLRLSSFISHCLFDITTWVLNSHLKRDKYKAKLWISIPYSSHCVPISDNGTSAHQLLGPQTLKLSLTFFHIPHPVHKHSMSALPSNYTPNLTSFPILLPLESKPEPLASTALIKSLLNTSGRIILTHTKMIHVTFLLTVL